MKSIKIALYVLCLCFAASCTPKVSQTSKSSELEVEATYFDCTIYTGITYYFFKSVATGDTIQVGIQSPEMRDPEDKTPIPKMPNKMIDDDPNLEGLPGAHPKMLGKKFKIIFNTKSEIIEVKQTK